MARLEAYLKLYGVTPLHLGMAQADCNLNQQQIPGEFTLAVSSNSAREGLFLEKPCPLGCLLEDWAGIPQGQGKTIMRHQQISLAY